MNTGKRAKAVAASRNKGGKSQKSMQRLRKAAALTMVVVVSAAFLTGYIVYKRLTSQFASAFSPSSYNILNENIYSVLLVNAENFDSDPIKVKQLTLFIMDKTTLKIIKYEIPLDLEIDVPGRFGYETFDKILALGRLESDDYSKSLLLLSDAVFKLMAFPVDRYVLTDTKSETVFTGLLNGQLKFNDEVSLRELNESVRTNFNFRELFDTYKYADSLPVDRIVQKNYISAYETTPQLLDEELMDITFDTEFADEKKSIAVLNGTPHSGIAGFSSRVVTNLGGRVVAVGNTAAQYETSVIIADDLTSDSVRLLKNVFRVEEVISLSEADGYGESEISRSDITLIIGLDFAGSM